MNQNQKSIINPLQGHVLLLILYEYNKNKNITHPYSKYEICHVNGNLFFSLSLTHLQAFYNELIDSCFFGTLHHGSWS